MKAKLLVSQSGLAAGATYDIDGQPGLRSAVLKNGEVGVSVPLADIEIVGAAVAAPERAPEPLPEHVFIDEINEDLARGFYDEYCEAVGGKAFNGDPLPPADEFFTDPAKAKQANAYRAAIAKMVPPESYSMESDDRDPDAGPTFPRAAAVLQREIETLSNNEPIHRAEGREERADNIVDELKELHLALNYLGLVSDKEPAPTPEAPNHGIPATNFGESEGDIRATDVADESKGSYSEQTAQDDVLDQQLEESQKADAEPTEEETGGQFTESVFPSDEDLDELLPEKQADCTEGESCESCQ